MKREFAPPWVMITLAMASITCSGLMIHGAYGLAVAVWHWARAIR